MFTVIGLMLGGMCIGFLLRKKQYPGIRLLITALIWILLFLLGIEVGSNRQIIEGLATLGLEAFIITFATVIGSCICAWLLGRWLYHNKKKGGEA